jgi:hypothetical protein
MGLQASDTSALSETVGKGLRWSRILGERGFRMGCSSFFLYEILLKQILCDRDRHSRSRSVTGHGEELAFWQIL